MTGGFEGRIIRRPDAALRGYVQASVLVAASTLVGMAIAPLWGNSPVDLLYLPAVLAVAVVAGLRPSLFAAMASSLAYNFFFTAPYHNFRIHSPADIVTVVVLFLVAVVTSQLAASIRKQAQLAEGHAARNATVAGLARRLLSCTSEQDIANVAVKELGRVFGCNVMLLAGPSPPRIVSAEPATLHLTPSDIASAAAVFATGKPMGRGLTGVTTIEWQLHPVSSDSAVLAVAGAARDDGAPAVSSEQFPLLGSLLDQIALAIERARLEGEAREFAALRERDRTRSALLSSIGQDLRPKLDAIASAVADLRRSGSGKRELVATIGSEAMKLDRYIADLVELDPGADQHPIETHGLIIDLFRRAVLRHGQQVHLTPKEYAVLAELAKHPGRVLTHAHLLRSAWGPAQESQTEYLRVAVRGLRQKIERNPAKPEIIVNEPAIGYRLVA